MKILGIATQNTQSTYTVHMFSIHIDTFRVQHRYYIFIRYFEAEIRNLWQNQPKPRYSRHSVNLGTRHTTVQPVVSPAGFRATLMQEERFCNGFSNRCRCVGFIKSNFNLQLLKALYQEKQRTTQWIPLQLMAQSSTKSFASVFIPQYDSLFKFHTSQGWCRIVAST